MTYAETIRILKFVNGYVPIVEIAPPTPPEIKLIKISRICSVVNM